MRRGEMRDGANLLWVFENLLLTTQHLREGGAVHVHRNEHT